MDINAVLEAGPPTAQLPPELQLHVLSFLPPIDLALGGRLSCKEAAQRFSERHHRTAPISQPLPGHVVDSAWCLEGAQASMVQLTSYQKLHMLSTAAASGCEANLEFAWQLLQPHVFPELLHKDDYLLQVWQWSSVDKELDLGSAAVSSGLAHLLPSLAQRCPGLLDPGRTLEAAARHCDLAGLHAVWELLMLQLFTVLAKTAPDLDRIGYDPNDGTWAWEALVNRKQWVFRETMAAVAALPTRDALAKMKWVLSKDAASCITVRHPTVCGAAAASGDLARLAWMRDHGFPWGTEAALAAVMRHAELRFIQRLDQEGGYLPPAEDEAWTSERVLCEAAASPRDGTAKLLWLGSRNAALGSWNAMRMAAACGNLEAVKLLAGQPGLGPAEVGDGGDLPSAILHDAIGSGSVPMVAWLRQAGYPWYVGGFDAAFRRGDLPMVRWLLEAGCPRGERDSLRGAVDAWPCLKPAAGGRLVEVVRLLAAAGWPAVFDVLADCLTSAAVRHPSSVVLALRELLPAAAQGESDAARLAAASSGCEATLEALVGLGLDDGQHDAHISALMYAAAAEKGDRCTLACLVRLGVPLGEGALRAAVHQLSSVPALQWLVEQGAPRSGAEEALREGPRWLYEEVEAWLRGLPGAAQGQ